MEFTEEISIGKTSGLLTKLLSLSSKPILCPLFSDAYPIIQQTTSLLCQPEVHQDLPGRTWWEAGRQEEGEGACSLLPTGPPFLIALPLQWHFSLACSYWLLLRLFSTLPEADSAYPQHQQPPVVSPPQRSQIFKEAQWHSLLKCLGPTLQGPFSKLLSSKCPPLPLNLPSPKCVTGSCSYYLCVNSLFTFQRSP